MNDGAIHICSICRCDYTGFRNNAHPVNHGYCCDTCDLTVVIPRRLRRMLGVTEDSLKAKTKSSS
jgi:hypothetical protein